MLPNSLVVDFVGFVLVADENLAVGARINGCVVVESKAEKDLWVVNLLFKICRCRDVPLAQVKAVAKFILFWRDTSDRIGSLMLLSTTMIASVTKIARKRPGKVGQQRYCCVVVLDTSRRRRERRVIQKERM